MEENDPSCPPADEDLSNPSNSAVGNSIRAVVSLIREAMKGAPVWARVVLALAAVGALAAVLVGVKLITSGHAGYGFSLVLVFVLILFVESLFAQATVDRPSSRTGGGLGAPGAVMTPWVRVVPRWPISEDAARELRRKLEDIRNAAVTWLDRRRPDLQLTTRHVRANVFLPDYTKTASGDVCELFMPEKLRVGMEGHPDERIRFRPRQGLTGIVFIEQKQRYAQTFETREGQHDWEDIYELTEEQKHTIHPELRWIVSFPLRISNEGQKRAGGVLNVDGLVHELSRDDLQLLMGELLLRAALFADTLGELPRTRVTITVENLTNA